MTAPASLPALIAEGRRLIAAATPGPVRAGRSDMISYGVDDDRPYKNIYVGAATARRARNDVPDDLAKVWGVNCIADATLFAFAVNNLAALLDVAEAGAKARAAETEPDDNVAPYPIGPRACHEYGCPCTKIGKKFGPCDCGGAAIQERIDASRAALDSALSKLRGVRT